MATHEHTPLLTVVERDDASRSSRRRGLAALGVCATLGVAACVGVSALRSGAAGPSLGDALDDALARLRGLDTLDEASAAAGVPSWSASVEADDVEVPKEGAGETTESAVDRIDAAYGYDEPVTEVNAHAYDELELDANGEPMVEDVSGDGFEGEDSGDDAMEPPVMDEQSVMDEQPVMDEPPMDEQSAGGDDATEPPVMDDQPVMDEPPMDEQSAEGPSAYDDLLPQGPSSAYDDLLADAPSTGDGELWGDDWVDLDEDMDRIKKLAKKLGPKNKTLVADYPPVPPQPDLPKQLSPSEIIVVRNQSSLPFELRPTFPGPLPLPITDGNEVVAAAVANVPGVGFSDAQVDMVRANKERNAGLNAGDLTTRAFYYALVDSFNLTNCACGGESLNTYLVNPALNESFSLAADSMSQPIAGVATDHCEQYNVPTGTFPNFDSSVIVYYTIAADRDALGDKDAIDAFAKESTAIVHTPDFYTLLQAGILESGASPDHEGSDVVENGAKLKLMGFIVLEGPPGTAQAVERTNGPVLAATA